MARQYTTLEMLERLIAFNTTSSLSNLPIIDFIEAYLHEWGIAAYRTVSAEGDKSNLWATIGPQDLGGGIVAVGGRDATGAAVEGRDRRAAGHIGDAPVGAVEADGDERGRRCGVEPRRGVRHAFGEVDARRCRACCAHP